MEGSAQHQGLDEAWRGGCSEVWRLLVLVIRGVVNAYDRREHELTSPGLALGEVIDVGGSEGLHLYAHREMMGDEGR